MEKQKKQKCYVNLIEKKLYIYIYIFFLNFRYLDSINSLFVGFGISGLSFLLSLEFGVNSDVFELWGVYCK